MTISKAVHRPPNRGNSRCRCCRGCGVHLSFSLLLLWARPLQEGLRGPKLVLEAVCRRRYPGALGPCQVFIDRSHEIVEHLACCPSRRRRNWSTSCLFAAPTRSRIMSRSLAASHSPFARSLTCMRSVVTAPSRLSGVAFPIAARSWANIPYVLECATNSSHAAGRRTGCC